MPICMPRPSSLAGPVKGALIPRVISVAVTPGAVAVNAWAPAGAAGWLGPAAPSRDDGFPPHASQAATAPPRTMIKAAETKSRRRGLQAAWMEVGAAEWVGVRAP